MDELIQIFIDHLLFDKEFVEELMPRLEKEFRTIGGFLKKHSNTLYCKESKLMDELFDFLDGNGFVVERPENPLPWDEHPVKLIPIYIEETVYEEETEEKEPVNSIYFPVQTCSLYYTPVEAVPRHVLEYQKLRASWSFWLRFCRRVELLRLVSESRGGSAAVPRPP